MLDKQDLRVIGFLLNRVTLKADEAATFVELVKKIKAEVDAPEAANAKEEGKEEK